MTSDEDDETDPNPFPKRITKKWEKQIDSAIADFIIYGKLPFNLVENVYFKRLMKVIVPGYTPPSRGVISGSLLQQKLKATTEAVNKVLILKSVVSLSFY